MSDGRGRAGILAQGPSQISSGSFPLVELRQYMLHEGMRDRLIGLFEREFVESQEALGMKVIGTFADLDRPDHFVWLRGFRDMASRLEGLTSFYSGETWRAYRNDANATMIDSDNVLLLRAAHPSSEFALANSRPALGEKAEGSLIVATIEYLKESVEAALEVFEAGVKPALEACGIRPIACFVPETAANDFPRLPVREGEQVLVWFARFRDTSDHHRREDGIKDASAMLASLRARPPEVLRLSPTMRSELR